jgi:hypothetical protein
MGLPLGICLLPFEVGGWVRRILLEMLGREFESHQLPNELFCVWGMNPENPGTSMPQLGRFWGVPMQSSFLKFTI